MTDSGDDPMAGSAAARDRPSGVFCWEHDDTFHLFRFYRDGHVIYAPVSAYTQGETDDAAWTSMCPEPFESIWPSVDGWFHRDKFEDNTGAYVTDGDVISFSILGEQGVVDYRGTWDVYRMVMDSHSHINGHRSTGREYKRVLKSQRFEGPSVQAAEAAARAAVPPERIHAIEVVRDVARQQASVNDRTKEGAIEFARRRIPAGATDIAAPVMEREGGCEVVTVEGPTWEEAHDARQASAPWGTSLVRLDCIRRPRRGFLGIGKAVGRWTARSTSLFQVAIDYTMPAVVEVKLTPDD